MCTVKNSLPSTTELYKYPTPIFLPYSFRMDLPIDVPSEPRVTSPELLEGDDEVLFAMPTKAPTPKANPRRASTRTSILSINRRMSKSIVGIPFEDQVAAIDSGLPFSERLDRLLKICTSAALKAIQQEAQEDSDEKMSDLIDDIVATMRKKESPSYGVEASKIEERIKCINGDNSHADLLPARVRLISDYKDKLNAESESWKGSMEERKKQYKIARATKMLVLRGERKLSLENCAQLSNEEKEMLDGISDGHDMMARLIEQEKKMSQKEAKVQVRLKAIKRSVEEVEEQNIQYVKKIKAMTEQNHTESVSATIASTANGESKFAAEVSKWLKEVKN